MNMKMRKSVMEVKPFLNQSSNCPEVDMQLAQQSNERVLIYSPDTDVYNIGLSLIHTHPDTDLFCSILWGEIPIPWKALRNDPHLATLPQNELGNTVEPPNKGHFGSRAFVLFSEVVLWWEVRTNMQFIAPSRPNIYTYIECTKAYK